MYRIPANFVDGGRLFGGQIRTRNFIEGLVMGGFFLLLARMLPLSSGRAKVTVCVIFTLLPMMIGIAGINNDPVSVFLRCALSWRRNRGVMLYNAHTPARGDDIVVRMMEQQSPGERLLSGVRRLRSSRPDEQRKLVEGVDFVFRPDDELTLYTERGRRRKGAETAAALADRILGTRENPEPVRPRTGAAQREEASHGQ